MSVSVCSDRHYNSVELALQSLVLQNSEALPYRFRKTYRMEHQVTALVDTLRDLNLIVYAVRYHKQGEVYAPTARSWSEGSVKLNLPGLFQALDCVLYQLELEHLEGIRELTEAERDAFTWAGHIRTGIAVHLTRTMAEEQKTAWAL